MSQIDYHKQGLDSFPHIKNYGMSNPRQATSESLDVCAMSVYQTIYQASSTKKAICYIFVAHDNERKG